MWLTTNRLNSTFTPKLTHIVTQKKIARNCISKHSSSLVQYLLMVINPSYISTETEYINKLCLALLY